MRTAPALLLLAVALGACAVRGDPTLVGKYEQQPFTARDAPSWRGVVGRWTHEFSSDGRLRVVQAGGMRIDARYRLDGDLLTITDVSGSGSCRLFGTDLASARYRVHFERNRLRYEALQDECLPRRTGMTIHPWLRVQQ